MIAANIYTTLCAILVCFQLSLVLGAPLGHLTQGGFNPGVLPLSGRALAALSAALLAAMAIVVQRHARGQTGLRWPIWVVLCITTLTTIANIGTPSFWERALWAPVASMMLVCAVIVWWRGPNNS